MSHGFLLLRSLMDFSIIQLSRR